MVFKWFKNLVSGQPKTDIKISAFEIKSRLTPAIQTADPSTIIEALHKVEFDISDKYEWPWLRWRYLAIEDSSYLGALPHLSEFVEGASFEHQILHAAISTRHFEKNIVKETNKGAALPDFSKLFEEDHTNLKMSLELELVMIAFHDRRWPDANRIARRMLSMRKLNTSQQSLLAEIIFFATYRPHMQNYIAAPELLIEQLRALSKDPLLKPYFITETQTGYTYKANVAALEGKFGEAFSHYKRANTFSGFKSPVFQQTDIILDPDTLYHAKGQEPFKWYKSESKVEFFYPNKPNNKHAILVACEPNYFNRFGKLYAEIIGITNPGALIHFHLINFTESKAAIRTKLKEIEAANNVAINYTFEDNKIARTVPRLIGGICVCTRYIYLPGYLKKYASVTITDIDGWLFKSIDALQNFKDNDILIASMIWRKDIGYWRLPWGNVSGGYCSFNGSVNGQKLASLISKYLATVCQQNAYANKQLFYADQAALFLCAQYLSKNYDLKVGFIGGGFSQSEELPFQTRQDGKRLAMLKKRNEFLEANMAK